MKKIDINKLSDLVKLKRKEKDLTQSKLENLNIDFNDIIEDNSEQNVLLAMRGKSESPEETEALDNMISMMLCFKKHDILRSRLNG